MSTKDSHLLMPQRRLHYGGLVVLIAIANMVPPFATDMYLPGLPSIASDFHASVSTADLTMTLFTVFYAVGMLIFGPFCDKYGRKPMFLLSALLFAVFSGACSLAGSMQTLILFRILEGLGGGGIASVSTAMIKDSFDGNRRRSILSVVQVLMTVAPIVAPLIGAGLVNAFSWRATFVGLMAFGLVTVAFSLPLQECIREEERLQGPPLASLKRLPAVLQHKGFLAFCILFGLAPMAFMSYIALSSYIYMDLFGKTATQCSILLAIIGIPSLVGPASVLWMRRWSPAKAIALHLSLDVIARILMLVFGHRGAWVFMLCFAPMAFGSCLFRPVCINLLLTQHKTDTGSASAVINASSMVFSAIGIFVSSLLAAWNLTAAVGVMMAFCTVLGIILFLLGAKGLIHVENLHTPMGEM